MTRNDIETPIMPTGCGVADLEIAREEDALLSGEPGRGIAPEQAPMDDAAGGPQAHDPAPTADVTASGAE